MKTYTTTVIEDPENPDEVIITFPEEMMAELKWVEGDTVKWEVKDGQAFITKVENGKTDS